MTTVHASRRLTAAVVMAITVAAAAVLVPMPAVASEGDGPSRRGPAPIVLFPAWHFTRLKVTVDDQRTDPGCPRSGTFEDLVFFDPGPPFSQVCRDELLTLRYDPNPHTPMRLRFSEQPGVTVKIADYGLTSSAPDYEPMYQALEAAGYTRDRDIRVAGYDARLTPDMAGFLAALEGPHRSHLPGQRSPARPPRRPFQRADLRAVPADAYERGVEGAGSSTASRRWPATSRVRGWATR